MLIASLLIALVEIPRWLVTLFVVLIIFDVIGTGLAAYFLEANALFAFILIALAGWVVHLTSDSPRTSKL